MATDVLTFKKRNREREKQRLKLPDLPHLVKMTYGLKLGLKDPGLGLSSQYKLVLQ